MPSPSGLPPIGATPRGRDDGAPCPKPLSAGGLVTPSQGSAVALRPTPTRRSPKEARMP